MANTDFTTTEYRSLCQSLAESDYRVLRIKDHLLAPEDYERAILLRHDVDRNPQKALEMALIEREFDLKSTYYLRVATFSANLARRIQGLGHEIGYHYEVLSKERGRVDRAVQRFTAELRQFRAECDVSTAAMHGSPLSRWNNLDLWKHVCPEDFGLLGEVYLSIDYTQVAYLTDTGRSWSRSSVNIRDHVVGNLDLAVSSTDELIEVIRRRGVDRACILAHPSRWATGRAQLILFSSRDHLANMAKFALRRIRDTSKED